MAKNATLIKKLTTKAVMGADGPDEIFALLGDKKSVDLYHCYGTATGTKVGTSQFGDWTALTGRFRAVNLLTGECFESGRCLMPPMALELVTGRLGATEQDKAVEFAFTVGIKADKKAGTGYQYTATPMLAPTEADPMIRLEAAAGIVSGLKLESKG